MEFPVLTRPDALWALLLLPLLYLLARPPRPRQSVLTAHMTQWLRARDRLHRRRVRPHNLRLALLMLVALALVANAAGLSSPGRPGPQRLVVLLDGSASMAAGDGERTAYREAVDRMRGRFRALPEHVAVRLLVRGAGTTVLAGARARALVGLPEPAGSGGGLAAAAAALAAHGQLTAVWTLSDGLGPQPLPAAGALTVVGGEGPNLALRPITLEDRWPLPGVRVTVAVENFSTGSQVAQVAVDGPVLQVPPQVLELPTGEGAELIFDLQRDMEAERGGGVLTVTLHCAEDRLATDNTLAWRLPPVPAPDVAVLEDGESGPWLRLAGAALAETLGGRTVYAAGLERAGFVLADGGRMSLLGVRRGMTFGVLDPQQPPPRTLWLRPVVVDWDREDPVTRGLDLSGLRIHRALPHALPPGRILVWGDRGPLVVVRQGPDGAALHAAFRLADSNLPLLAAFPQLVQRTLALAYGSQETPPLVAGGGVPAGESRLIRTAPTGDRPLPTFGAPPRSLGPFLLVAAALALALRLWL